MPPTATVVGEDLKFGVGDNDEASLVTQSIKHTLKSDKKEAKGKDGSVIAVAFYNKTSDVTIEGLGETDGLDVSDTLSLANTLAPAPVGTLFVDQIDVEYPNEDFVKSTIKATGYAGIPS